MNIDWNKIKDECPKGYSIFRDYCIICGFAGIPTNLFIVYDLGYCLLENFFDNREIIATYRYLITENLFKYFVYNKNDKSETYSLPALPRSEAKEQAVYKEFEIFEKRLNEVKNDM